MEDEIKKLYNLVITHIVNEGIKNEIKIENTIRMFSNLPIFPSKFDEDNIKQIKNRILSERSVVLELGALIEAEDKPQKWFKSKKAELNMDYWNRYKQYLLKDKNFSMNVINTMDDILDDITDSLGNPKSDIEFQRRGLIIGDVQSGKTSNYTGLLCKAADAGYKAIVLLTGTIEKLRKQTQLRLDEGFVGRDSAAMIKQKENNIIGVGKYNPSIVPMVLTSTTSDFNLATAKNLGFDLNTVGDTPVLFVIKKNVSTLKNLNKWLKVFNQYEDESINSSLLIIDDESDNASVNTNPEDRNPTTINSQIRELLNRFKRASYVGYTATPFANIFIDPDTKDKMLQEDLFPKDYIYSLNSPSNYIGARNIFDAEGNFKNMLVNIDEDAIETCLPTNHKGNDIINFITQDMKDAINCFLVANAVRDLRNDEKKHRSMLINVSRFTNIQEQLRVIVNNYLKDIQDRVRLYSKLSIKEALKDHYINDLYLAFKKHYNELEFSWEDIQKVLKRAIMPIEVVTVNQKNKNGLNYEENEENGLRVIAIGGLSLSRGLTLEGLMTSYFYRNSKMYDTLMQMGRWFGYRNNYEDLCKIWMSKASIEWYEHISQSTDELRRDIKRYEKSGYTPKQFGIRVRSDINVLLVTARNKMRTASSIEAFVSLSGEIIETPYLLNDLQSNNSNINIVEKLLYEIQSKKYGQVDSNRLGFRNIDKELIMDMLNEISVSPKNIGFDSESINNFIKGYKGTELNKWDVYFASTKNKEKITILDNEIGIIERGKFKLINNDRLIKLNRNRLGSISDGKYGLTEEQIKLVENNGSDKLSQRSYFKLVKRNPLLLIYMIDLKVTDEDSDIIDRINVKSPIVGLSIGIPELIGSKTHTVKYLINRIEQDLIDDIGDEE